MNYPWIALTIALGSVSLLACGDDGGSGTADTGTASDGGTTAGSTTVVAQTDTNDGSGGSTGTGSGGSGSGSGGDTTGETAGTGADESTSSGSTGEGSTTGVNVDAFERFLMSSAAGPCGPGGDCDGFVELLASGTLRVETFGDVTKVVTEVEISPEDFDAAVLVFADPALLALLDGSDPVCDPPTDIFESMTVEIDGTTHESSTTACADPPVAAAREMAVSLRTEYVP